MNRFLDSVRTLWLAGAAIGVTTVGGLALAVAVRGGGVLAVLGVLLVTGGVVIFMATVMLVLRREHATGQRIARGVTRLSKGGRGPAATTLDTSQLDDALEHQARRIVAAVDARIIGLHERERST